MGASLGVMLSFTIITVILCIFYVVMCTSGDSILNQIIFTMGDQLA